MNLFSNVIGYSRRHRRAEVTVATLGPRRRLLRALAGLRGQPEPEWDKAEPRGEAERRQLTVMFLDLPHLQERE
jgi:hypothetical protein